MPLCHSPVPWIYLLQEPRHPQHWQYYFSPSWVGTATCFRTNLTLTLNVHSPSVFQKGNSFQPKLDHFPSSAFCSCFNSRIISHILNQRLVPYLNTYQGPVSKVKRHQSSPTVIRIYFSKKHRNDGASRAKAQFANSGELKKV